jgi:transposase
MDQYSRTPLFLPNFIVVKEATQQFIHGVPSYVIHGKLIEPNYRYCPFCHGHRMQRNGTRNIRLRHVSIGKSIIYVEVSYKRWECQDCHKTFRHRIPFREKGHNITKVFAKEIEHFLSIGETPTQCSKQLHYNRTTIQHLDKKRIRTLAKDMKPRHPSRFICVDEFLLHKGHEYATIVIDYETGESLFATQGNTYGQMIEFFRFVGRKFMKNVQAVSMDMNASYAKAFREYYPHITIVYDGFHMVKNYNDMVLTEVRRAEQRRIDDEIEKALSEGNKALVKELREEKKFFKNSRYLILSNRKTLELKDASASEYNDALFERYEKRGLKLPIGKHYLSAHNIRRLDEVLSANEKLQTCYTLGEMLKSSLWCRDENQFFNGFNQWISMAKKTGYEELERYSSLIRRHWQGILARITYPISNGPLEGTNCLVKNIRRQSYGIRDDEYFFLRIWEATRKHPKHRTVDFSPHHFSA